MQQCLPYRLVIASDVVKVDGSRDTDSARQAVYDVVRAAFEAAGIDGMHREQDRREDGVYAVVDAVVPIQLVLGPWVQAVYWRLRPPPSRPRSQLDLSLSPQVRLRVGLHFGAAGSEGGRLVGTAVDYARDLRDSAPARRVMRDSADSPLAVVISDYVHESAVLTVDDHAERERYIAVSVTVSGSAEVAWLHVPGGNMRAEMWRPFSSP